MVDIDVYSLCMYMADPGMTQTRQYKTRRFKRGRVNEPQQVAKFKMNELETNKRTNEHKLNVL